jgi:hypothetical protein
MPGQNPRHLAPHSCVPRGRNARRHPPGRPLDEGLQLAVPIDADPHVGGAGADLLRSGGGEDAFVYLWMTGGNLATRDTIRGFASGEDVIDLSAIDANVNRGGNQAFIFGGGTGVGRVWVEDSATGAGSIIQANNGGAEQLYITVEDGAGRDASD